MIPTPGVSPNAADKTARPERLARVAMLTPDEKKTVHNSRKKKPKISFRFFARVFNRDPNDSSIDESTHRWTLWLTLARRAAGSGDTIRIGSLAGFVTFVWFVRRSRRASFAGEVEEERVRRFVHHRVRSPPRIRTLEAEDARRVVHVVAKRGTLNGTEVGWSPPIDNFRVNRNGGVDSVGTGEAGDCKNVKGAALILSFFS